MSSVSLVGRALSMGCLTSGTMHSLWSSGQNVNLECEFDFRERKFDLKVTLERGVYIGGGVWSSIKKTYKLEFRFKFIYCAYNAKIRGRAFRGPMLLFEVWNPPLVYEEIDRSLEEVAISMGLTRRQKQPWVRTVDFTPERSIGQSFAYVLEFPRESASAAAGIAKILSCLEDYRLASADTRLLNVKTASAYSDISPDVLVPLMKCPAPFPLSFRLMFVLNNLVQRGNVSGQRLSARFFQLLYETPEEQVLWVLNNLLTWDGEVGEDLVAYFGRELKKIETGTVRLPRTTSIQCNENSGQISVYRVMVTPTKIHCAGHELEVSNRVTREYINLIDNFIRVSFVDEDASFLSSQTLTGTEGVNGRSGVYTRIINVLRDGLRINGKHFEFLAYSSSQLREHSVWMFAESNGVSANSIRAWMGDFLGIRNVAKCAARMGQCFSSTTKTLPVNFREVEYIDDVKTADGKYCFSDGIGKISASFARKVARKCRCRGVPSAFQIRFGGFKGVVALCRGSRYKLSLRDSMNKFDSDHDDLEVINWTKRIPCFLNRQVITLLSTLGIEDHVFEEMQDLVLAKLNEVVSNIAVALDRLQLSSSGTTHKMTMAMLKAGYHPRTEPFLQSLLQAFRAFQLLQLRTKSRILVPKGRTMMGCLDETGILDYGQVFLRVSSFPGTQSFLDDGLQYEQDGSCVVTGRVVVAKNPCFHPGDVRVLQAVDVPALHHMVDCVVFPQQGSRPHPNECSGSDLDGDLYFVTWDQLLVPILSDAPMQYDPPETVILPRPVTVEDIQEFFVQYMKSNALGQIANAHVVHADQEPDMARDPKCIQLAELFTVAVDFPKTGKPAVMGPELRATDYPDFMEKEDKNSYESQRVLGSLYRSVLGEAKHTTLVSKITRAHVISAFDEELIWPGFKFYIEEATMLKSWYDKKLVGLMNQYKIKTEAEALSGNILPLTRYYVRKQHEVKERMSAAVRALQSKARGWFKYGPDSPDSSNAPILGEREKFAKASAWYYITYHEDYLSTPDQAPGGKHPYLLSFPWVVYDTLLAVKERNRRRF